MRTLIEWGPTVFFVVVLAASIVAGRRGCGAGSEFDSRPGDLRRQL